MPENWNQVKEIVALALEQAPETRHEFVRHACGQNDALRLEVESLIFAHGNADSLLENSPVPGILSRSINAMEIARVGAYRILHQIGQGGMAVVYLAERDDHQYQKRVAVKMVKPGTDTDQILRRFRNERQTLAALDHPNIVKLLDGGSTEAGLPYLVMEYVEGVPIDRYCDEHKLTIEERLQLFCSVCNAVEYAHTNAVVHRDLKPGNILITADGVARLLDFGIAKLLDPESLHAPLLTTGDWRPMTPEYASPEQIQGKPVTRAADIYSLGVLLYQLLTGRRPYQMAGRSLAEIERLVCETEPERPSTILTSDSGRQAADGGSTTELVSQARQSTIAELRRRLRGDLDTIVLKALRKAPEHRYQSAAEFSRDIQNHLSGLPVQARRPTLSYRSERFLRRHRESVMTAAVVVLVLGSFAGWEMLHGIRQPHSTTRAVNVALQPRRSLAIVGFKNLSGARETAWVSTALSEMLSNELSAGERLRIVPGEAVAEAKRDLALDGREGSLVPETLKKMGRILGSDLAITGSYTSNAGTNNNELHVDLQLQDTNEGRIVASVSVAGSELQMQELVRQASHELRQKLGVGDVTQADNEHLLAAAPSNPEAMRLYSQGLDRLRMFDALGARDLLQKAVAADPSYSLARAALASAWSTLGYEGKAADEARQAVNLGANLPREDYLRVEGQYYLASRNWDKAISTYNALFSFFPDNVDYGLQLASAQSYAGSGKEAVETLSALVQQNKEAGNDPRVDLAISAAASTFGDNRLRRDAAEQAAIKANRQGSKLLAARAWTLECRALANLGEHEKAESVCEQARPVLIEAGDRGAMVRLLHTMAEVPLNRGDFTTAEKLYRQSLAICREIGYVGAMGSEQVNLGLIAVKRGDFAAAEKLYGDALASYQQAGDRNGVAVVLGNTGNLLRNEGRLDEALKSYESTLTLSNELGHRGSAAEALAAIADVMVEEGDLPSAEKNYRQALAIQRDVGEQGPYSETLVSFGQLLRERDDPEQAQKSYEEALSIQQRLGDKEDIAETQLDLAELACDSGKPDEAERLTRAAQHEFLSQNQPNKLIEALSLMVRALLLQGKVSDAEKALDQALKASSLSQNVEVRMPLDLERANVLQAAGNHSAAETILQRLVSQARHLHFLQMELEASLSLEQLEGKGQRSSGSRARLDELAKMASAHGFTRIARKATARQ